MAEKFDLIAEFREDIGKGASRRLRRQGMVPAVIYGAGKPPRSVTFDHNKVIKQLENASFYSSVLNVKVGDKSQAVILKDMQRHPSRRVIMHMDLQRIVEDEVIRMTVPIRFHNEDIAPGVKTGGGKVAHLMNDVEVVCLPKDLPEYLEIDIADLELDELRYLSDLTLPEGVEIPALAQGEEANRPIVSIHIIKEVVIEEEEEELEEGLEVAAEGEEPAEGEAPPEEGAPSGEESKEE